MTFTSPNLAIEPFVITKNDLIRDIKITARRYTIKTGRTNTDTDLRAAAGIVLFLAHGAGLRMYYHISIHFLLVSFLAFLIHGADLFIR